MPGQLLLKLDESVWCEVKDGNDAARSVFDRHYSRRRYRDGRKPLLFVGPGEKIVLITPACDAVFVWRKFISDDGQQGVNCAVFRNESAHRASDLLRSAMQLAWAKWPGERLYTYVDPRKVKTHRGGHCFRVAGWRFVKTSTGKRGRRVRTKKKGLFIYECLPEWVQAAREKAA